MKKAIATIKTEIGTMTIYYNGADEEMTGENGDLVEEIGYMPENVEDAIDAVYQMYSSFVWELEIIA